MSRTILKNLLEDAGYSVTGEATNGEEAVEMYHQKPSDLVTLDITMPKMDGIEALQKILDADPDAKVIMITAAGQQSKVLDALKFGAKQFITKPFEADVVLNSVSEVLGK
ncbi:MAG: response regulator [Lachnospiraceae bacterium]|nr:response regulator [Lachnospiraceae bacterium]